MANLSKITRDHEELRRWAEERGGKPAHVKNTGSGDDIGILRIDFPGYSGEGTLEPISWEDFFKKFDERGLALVYQEETAGGQKSNFNKLVSAETVEEGAGAGGGRQGRSGGSRSRSGGSKRSRSGTTTAVKKGGAPKKAAASTSARSSARGKSAAKTSAKKASSNNTSARKGGAKKSTSKAAAVKRSSAKKASGRKQSGSRGAAKKSAARRRR
jgi:hypothetical protein